MGDFTVDMSDCPCCGGVSSCCGCGDDRVYELTISGITNGVCDDCDAYNDTFLLSTEFTLDPEAPCNFCTDLGAVVCANDTFSGPLVICFGFNEDGFGNCFVSLTIGYLADDGVGEPDITDLIILAGYSRAILLDEFDCDEITVDLVSTGGSCDNFPLTLTLTAVP